MLILDSPQSVATNRLKIPTYHRSHLSLKSGTEVTVCLIPWERKSGTHLSELIVTPLPVATWTHLWRVTGVFHDAPGVVSLLLSALRMHRVNVLLQETTSIESRRRHVVEMVVDMSSSSIALDDNGVDLWQRLVAICAPCLCFEHAEPQLRLRRMKGLTAAAQRLRDASFSSPRPIRAKATIAKGEIVIPKKIYQKLIGSKESTGSRRLTAVLMSNTKDRLLRVFVVPGRSRLLYARISHLDQVGVLADITASISTSFDILGSFNRVHKQGKRNQLEVLLEPTFELRRGESAHAQLRGRFEHLLSAEALEDYDLLVNYPRSTGAGADEGEPPKRQTARHFALPVQQDIVELSKLHTVDLLARRLDEARNTLKRARGDAARLNEQNRWIVLDNLHTRVGGRHGQPTLFLSYDFREEGFLVEVERIAKELNWRIVDGRRPQGNDPFRQVIVQRIKSADLFAAIWSYKDKRKRRLSPWLVWELGVAQGLGVPFFMCVEDDVDRSLWKDLNPEKHHTVFSREAFYADFREAFRGATLTHLKSTRRS